MTSNNNIIFQFCNSHENLKYKLIESLDHDIKVRLLTHIAKYISAPTDQIEFASASEYINDALVAFSEQVKEHENFESDFLNHLSSLLKSENQNHPDFMPSYAKPIEFKSNKITAKDAPWLH